LKSKSQKPQNLQTVKHDSPSPPAGGREFSPAYRNHFGDGFINLLANLGQGAENALSAGEYRQTQQVTWDRETLDAMIRQSWIVRRAVEAIAEDMTREGIEIHSQVPPEDEDKILRAFQRLSLWDALQSGIMWGRLYGGAGAIMLIDGQDMATPLRLETIGPGSFKGLFVLDRWTLWPSVNRLITAYGPDYGLPEYYEIATGVSGGLDSKWVHHSRVLRFIGNKLPYWQAIRDLWWGQSIVETMFDRLEFFDSASSGTAQLVHKAFIRTLKIPNLTNMLAANNAAQDALLRQVMFMKITQGIEGITMIDANETLESMSYQFSGLKDVLIHLAEQVAGATGIPVARLFGQAPAGMNATGEHDLKTYYDMIAGKQQKDLNHVIDKLLRVLFRSVLGIPVPQDLTFAFRPLWKLSDVEKASIWAQDIAGIVAGYDSGILPADVALREIRELSDISGRGSNITDEDIAEAQNAPPISEEPPLEGIPGITDRAADISDYRKQGAGNGVVGV
jgi:phage-related protein (TIGR01555 family)